MKFFRVSGAIFICFYISFSVAIAMDVFCRVFLAISVRSFMEDVAGLRCWRPK